LRLSLSFVPSLENHDVLAREPRLNLTHGEQVDDARPMDAAELTRVERGFDV
jgi:hypothetical protein